MAPKYFHNLFLFNILHVSSESMEPKIKKGDFVIVKRLTYNECSDLKPKDIIVFYINEEYRTNEILKKIPLVLHEVQHNDTGKEEIRTKGINNSEVLDFEKKISYDNVMYKEIFKISKDDLLYFVFFLFFFINSILILFFSKSFIKKFFKKNYLGIFLNNKIIFKF
ncbi:S24/S26 family peptidase ['Camptotheca acuminata' phytoplasma]